MLSKYLNCFEYTHAVVKWPKIGRNVEADCTNGCDKLQGDRHYLSDTQAKTNTDNFN